MDPVNFAGLLVVNMFVPRMCANGLLWLGRTHFTGLLAVNCTCIVSSDSDLQLIFLEEMSRAEKRHRTYMSSGKRVREEERVSG